MNHVGAHGRGPEGRPAGLGLVFASAVYDGLVSVAIMFVVTTLAVTVNRGEAIAPGSFVYELSLLVAPFPYFAWCWMRGGQTLGMRAWQVRLAREGGHDVNLQACAARYLGALASWAACGIGFLWLAVGPQNASWHDRLSGTRIYRLL